RGLWRRSGAARWALSTDWLGRGPSPHASPHAPLLRCLAALGPATAADARAWSTPTPLADLHERPRSPLSVCSDARGRELFDLPDAPRPHPDTEASVRVLPEFDHALLSHADGSRFRGPAQPRWAMGSILVEGVLGGNWKYERTGRRLEMY